MPDPIKPEDKAAAEESRSSSDALVERLVGSIQDTLKAARPAEPVARPEPAFDAQAALDKAMDAYDAACANGEYKKGLQTFLSEYAKINAAQATDPEKDDGVQHMAETTLALAEQRHADMFEKYGDEVRAEINAMPVKDRVRMARVDEAIKRVKARHIDSISDELVERKLAERLEQSRAPQSGPSRELGETAETELHGLDLEDRRMARSLRVTNKDFARHAKTRMNKDGSFSILPDLDKGGVVEPGRF